MGSSGHGDGAVVLCVCVYITHGILWTRGWGCCTLRVCVCVCVYVYNPWDPSDMGMGLYVCVYIQGRGCFTGAFNSWDPPDTGIELHVSFITQGVLQTWRWGCTNVCMYIRVSSMQT